MGDTGEGGVLCDPPDRARCSAENGSVRSSVGEGD